MNMSRGRLAAVAGSFVLVASAVTLTALPATGVKATGIAKTTRAAAAAPRVGALPATDVVVRADAVRATGVQPAATPPSGYAPADLLSAYNLNSAVAAGGGTGATVAVIGAYDDPNAEADLAVYRTQYGLPACTTANGCFSKVNENGAASPLPGATNVTYAQAESIDLDMVSAICPNCHILLVEANTPGMPDPGIGVNSAVALGARYVVFGAYTGGNDHVDGRYVDHPGVAITAPAGDYGYSVAGDLYPASSQYVTAVGGTTLTKASNARGWSESVWTKLPANSQGTGSGCARPVLGRGKPSWQTDTGCTGRTDNDVAAVADPNTGVAFYDTDGQTGWAVGGGTTVSAAIVGGVYALAGTPQAGTYPVTYPYLHSSSLNQVTTGSNAAAGCTPAYLCTAGSGYNGPAGWGTPDGTAGFTFGTVSGDYVAVINPGTQIANKLPATVSIPVTAVDSATGEALTYSATGLPTGVAIDSSSGLITGTVTAAYTGTATVTATDPTGAQASVSFGWNEGNIIGVSIPGNPWQTKPNTAVSLQIHAADTDTSQALTFSATGLPPGLSIDSSTGLISGTTTSTIGTYTVTVTAKDSTGSAGSSSFTWRVWNLITVTAPASTEASSAGSPITPVQVTATDSTGGTTFTYSAANLPPGLSIDPASGLITGTPSSVSNVDVTVTATDGTGSAGSAVIVWTVHGVITIANPGYQTSIAITNVNLPITATDSAAGDTLTYSIANAPPGLSMYGTSNVVTGVPTFTGTYQVTVTATGLYGGSGSVTFNWTILAKPLAVTYSGTLRLYKMGYCLDDRNNSSTNGAVVQIWRCNGLPSQRWQVMSDGTIRHNGLCLDTKGSGTANGTKVQLWACNGNGSQQWDTGTYRIHYDNPFAARGKVLDDTGFGGNGTQQQIWTNRGTINQLWETT